MDYRAAVAEYLKVNPAQVEAARVENSEVVCLVNYGIAGTKKFSLSLAELTPAPVVEEVIETTAGTPFELVVSPVVVEKPKERRLNWWSRLL